MIESHGQKEAIFLITYRNHKKNLKSRSFYYKNALQIACRSDRLRMCVFCKPLGVNASNCVGWFDEKTTQNWQIKVTQIVKYLVWGSPKIVPTPTRGRQLTTFFTVAWSGKLNMTPTVNTRVEIRQDFISFILGFLAQ